MDHRKEVNEEARAEGALSIKGNAAQPIKQDCRQTAVDTQLNTAVADIKCLCKRSFSYGFNLNLANPCYSSPSIEPSQTRRDTRGLAGPWHYEDRSG